MTYDLWYLSGIIPAFAALLMVVRNLPYLRREARLAPLLAAVQLSLAALLWPLSLPLVGLAFIVATVLAED